MKKLTEKYPRLKDLPLEVSQAMHVLLNAPATAWDKEQHEKFTEWLVNYIEEHNGLLMLRALFSVVAAEKGPITVGHDAIKKYPSGNLTALEVRNDPDTGAVTISTVPVPKGMEPGMFVKEKDGHEFHVPRSHGGS